ncbi:DUF2244 domain-containing protein [Tropicimonas sp. IMCC34043]|uniref:DUF2244 domain-containing protein n=1 Tax=Tropicimonas sp. IMCC34043 TaxID=2248760 RepID=UPI000E288AFB|nr:DUF2244 domain-containing protein [Tropicimonas sp. IMCC34043]
MPVDWVIRPEGAPVQTGAFSHRAGAAPWAELHVWPHRSLPKRGFVWFIGTTFVLLLVPLAPALGSPVLWGLLPFVMGTLGLLYYFLMRSYRDGEIVEVLRIWSDHVRLDRHQRLKPPRRWEANPHWVEVRLHPHGGPVADYVTLRGAGREVEIGAFLSDDERLDLFRDLSRYLPLRG